MVKHVYFSKTHSKNRQARHKKSVKIGLSLFLVFTMSFTPSLWAFYAGQISGYFGYAFYINSLANFFVYLIIDEEFRAKLKAMCTRRAA